MKYHTNGITSEDNRKVAIVTRATSAAGNALVKHLLTRNFRVALIDQNTVSGQSLATQLNDFNSAQFFPCDSDSYASQAAVFRDVWKTWQRIDLCLLNCDGVAGRLNQSGSVYTNEHRGEDLDNVPAEPKLAAKNMCWKDVVYGTLLAAHFMRFNCNALHDKGRGGGRIVVNANIGDLIPHAAFPERCGVNAGVIQFVSGVAPPLKKQNNILVNVVLSKGAITPVMPGEVMQAVSPESRTSITTLLAANDLFISDETGQAGKVLEASAGQLVFHDSLEHGNEQAVAVWDSLLRAKQDKDSGLESIVDGRSECFKLALNNDP